MRNQGTLEIDRITTRSILHLKSWSISPGAPFLLAPTVPAECRLLALGPGEWLLISDTLAGHALRRQSTGHLQEQTIAIVDLSQGLAALRVEGTAALGVLTQGCGLDIHPRAFGPGQCTRTRFAQLPVVIDYMGATPRFELYVGLSYLPYMYSWLNDAAAGFVQSAQ